jgi:hypothetical protein
LPEASIRNKSISYTFCRLAVGGTIRLGEIATIDGLIVEIHPEFFHLSNAVAMII